MKELGDKITLNSIVFLLLQECFHSKDFLNLRYHHKRALYLAVLASHLKQSSFIENVKFIHMNGEVLRLILLLKPKGTVIIIIIVTVVIHYLNVIISIQSLVDIQQV